MAPTSLRVTSGVGGETFTACESACGGGVEGRTMTGCGREVQSSLVQWGRWKNYVNVNGGSRKVRTLSATGGEKHKVGFCGFVEVQ